MADATGASPTPEGEQPPVVQLTTDRGTVRLELFPDVAPKHVRNFVTLVQQGFYDGLRFHRVVPGFVAQAGCPHTRNGVDDPRCGQGGPGYQVAAEFNDRPHLRGTLGMARSGHPDSAGSQFYICLADASHLNHQYTVFGQVQGDGMAVVDTIREGDRIEKAEVVDE